jgi:hypothetical protein
MKTAVLMTVLLTYAGATYATAIHEVREGVYVDSDTTSVCGILVKREPDSTLALSKTTNPQTLRQCNEDGSLLVRFKCIGARCISDRFEITAADSQQILVQEINTKEVSQLKFMSAAPVAAKIFENWHFFGWSWEVGEHNSKRCSFDGGFSKICSDITRTEVDREIEEAPIVEAATAKPLQNCMASGLSGCRVEAIFPQILINQRYNPHPGYANVKYRTGRLVNVIVKGN